MDQTLSFHEPMPQLRIQMIMITQRNDQMILTLILTLNRIMIKPLLHQTPMESFNVILLDFSKIQVIHENSINVSISVMES